MAPFSIFDLYANEDFSTENSHECTSPIKSLHPVASRLLAARQNSETTKKNTRKSVSFDRRVIMRGTIHINDFTVEEIKACWSTKEELHSTKTDATIIAGLLEEGFSVQRGDNDVFCSRGLESVLQCTREKKQANRRIARRVVLYEQEMCSHDATGSSTSCSIATAYKSASSSARAQARYTGLADEKEVRTMHREESRAT